MSSPMDISTRAYLSTSESWAETELKGNEEGEWHVEGATQVSGPVIKPVQQGSVEQPVKYRAAKPTPVVWEAHPVRYQGVAHMPLTNGVESGQYQAMTHVPVAHGMYPVHHAMAQEVQPVQYQLTHCVQSVKYQALTQVPVVHGVYPVQYHATAHRAQPVQYMTPVSQGGQLHFVLVGSQGQLIDPGTQPHLTDMLPPEQLGYVTSPPAVPVPHLGMGMETPYTAAQAFSNAAVAPVGQRASALGRQKSRLHSLPKALVFDGRGSLQAFLTNFEKYAGIFEWEGLEKRDYLGLCLTEKASECYALVIGREVELGYWDVVEKLERRFCDRKLPETEMVTFSSARKGRRSLWMTGGDRVLALAGEAFKNLSEEYLVQESILRLCMGAKGERLESELLIRGIYP